MYPRDGHPAARSQRRGPSALHREASGSGRAAQSSAVDWAAIEQKLHNIPEDFKSQKFNSLKRVIEILSKDKPEWALAELQQELKKVEAVIDTVVDTHHLGFNNAIERYQKIISLFNECKSQVASLKNNFEEAQSRIGVVSTNLRGQWHTSMALQGSIAMLKDIQAAVEDHATLQQHVTKKEWLPAVPVLLRLANKLSLEDIANLGALSHIRATIRPAYDSITSALVSSIVELTFRRPAAMTVDAASNAAGASGKQSIAAAAAAGPVTHHSRISTLLAERQDAAAMKLAAEGLQVGVLEEGDVKVQAAVDGLTQLDAVDMLREGVLTAVEPQVRIVMETCITSIHDDVEAVANGAGEKPGSERALVPPAAHARICAASLALLTSLLLIFHNCCKLYVRLASVGDALVSARRLYGRVMRGLVRRDGGFASGVSDEAAIMKNLAEAAAGDRDMVWGLLQKEVIALFAYIIRAPFAQAAVAQPEAKADALDSQSGSQWLSSLLRQDLSSLTNLVKTNKSRPSNVTFRFGSTIAAPTSASTPGGPAGATAISPEPRPRTQLREYRDLADAALWRLSAPSPFLVACLYTPSTNFVREAGTLLSPPGVAGGSPLGGAAAGKAGGVRSVLQAFLDDFVRETLLPRVMADVRAASQSILSQKTAFLPSATQIPEGGGAFVLQAADALASLFAELAQWARCMPPYADAFCSVASVALEVLDERCTALFDGVMQQEHALAMLCERRNIANHLGAEPVVRFLEQEELFEDPFRESQSRSSDVILRAVLTATDTSSTQKSQADIVRGAQRLAGIAATLLHIAHAIEAHGRAFTTSRSAHTDLSSTTHPDGRPSQTLQPNDSMSARGRIQRLKSGSSGDLSGGLDGERSGGIHGAGGKPQLTLLPELRRALPSLNLPNRTHAATAAMLSRNLHSQQDVLPLNLVNISKKMRLRAGRCLSMLRLLVMSISAHTLSGLASTGSHILAADGARDRDPRLQGLVRTCARLDEELRTLLPRHCMQYIFGDVTRSTYRLLMWCVTKVVAINSVGLDRFLHWLLLLKGSLVGLTGLDASTSAMHGIVLQSAESTLASAQSFIRLLQGPVNNIILEASKPETRGNFDAEDWLSLLAVQVNARSVTKVHRQQLRQALDADSKDEGGTTSSGKPTMERSQTRLRDVEPSVLRSGSHGRAAGAEAGRHVVSATGSASVSERRTVERQRTVSRDTAAAESPAKNGDTQEGAQGGQQGSGEVFRPTTHHRAMSKISNVLSAMPWQRENKD